ncbi:MAG: ATP-binding protein [Rhodospirillaceae bacterium]|nr:ATP-binding protein [Rhodospirillaceae bacterium]
MLTISEADIAARITRDNPWWARGKDAVIEAKHPRRVYFDLFKKLSLNYSTRRATVLLGPRRVGKTVIAKQSVYHAIADGVPPENILYASIDAPIYAGIPLEKFLSFLPEKPGEQKICIFDEIQYLKDWERHLKDLVDSYVDVKFIATGSAAAALKLKSRESGAGRFSEFLLPPLTFYEFLQFSGSEDQLIEIEQVGNRKIFHAKDIDLLNKQFVDYLNFGGYPEAVLNEEIRENADQFIRNDIIDKVLLKDLPSLYGINDIQELNRLFSFLAYNTGNEASLENISRESGLTKPTIKRYIEYLENAFLIIKVSTVNENCQSMQRERHFKIYLTNPSMRAALFSPIREDEKAQIGHLVESAIFSQWQHSAFFRNLRYARWKNEGEIDVVYLQDSARQPRWIGEIKWSDRARTNFPDVAKHMMTFYNRHPSISDMFLTTRSYSSRKKIGDANVDIVPSAIYCYAVGRNITKGLNDEFFAPDAPADDVEASD